MTPENWKTIKPILEQALEIAPDGRQEFLKGACSDNEQIREVESLLANEGTEIDPFERSAFSIVTENGSAGESPSFIGKQIGRYTIISELGAGGMGTVFLAERSDGEFQQKVALKLIKSGMGSDSILRRFVSERQILASLDHANIARLIDGGTTDERLPYFVMEYVNGESVVDYARSRDLSLNERLDLFCTICGAVSFAHQNLVIHRDLKPTNILVSAEGVPKLLDFGIAKLLKTDISDETATQHFAFTPEYASPEQIRGENLTTATDVYSLGVILYELLTGMRPFSFAGKSFGKIVETVTQSDPARPSSLPKKAEVSTPAMPQLPFARSQLRGDLDNIILKALNKEPDRRYMSVVQFSDDIRLYLKGQPVRARQDTWRYRAGKFVRRNPLVAGAAALALLILIGGITATTLQARRANIERDKAERRFNDVRTLANSLIFEVNEKIDESPIKARELLVTRAIEYLDKLAAEAGSDQGLQAELASAYEKVGDVQVKYFGTGTGNTAAALANQHKALVIRQQLAAVHPNELQYALRLTSSYLKIADLSVTAGDTTTALANYDNAVAAIKSAELQDRNNISVKRELARVYSRLGQGILRSGSISISLENYEKAVAIAKEIAAENPEGPDSRRNISVYESYTGYAKLELGRLDEALVDFSESLQIDTEIWNADRNNIGNQRNLVISELWKGTALRHLQRFEEGRRHQQTALDMQQAIYETDKSNGAEINSLADCYLEIGWTIYDSGKPLEAIPFLKKGISLYEEVAKTDANNLSIQRQISFTRIRLADAVAKSGNKAEARQIFEKALSESESINLKDEKNSEFRHDKAVCHLRLAGLGVNTASNLDQAIPILEKLVAESPEHRERARDLQTAKDLLRRS